MIKLINISFLLLYCLLIYWLSSRSSLPTPMLFQHQDKILHLVAYFIMGILAWRFFSDYLSKLSSIIIISLIYCSLYGISDEWHQSWVPGRDADFLDWVADTLGATMALTLMTLVKTRKRIKNQLKN